MPTKYDGSLLETGMTDDEYWDEIKDKEDLRISIPARAKQWSKDIIRPLFAPTRTRNRPRPQVRPTAWLDGLRGFAAFLVYWHHHQLWAHEATTPKQSAILENAFGYQGQYYFACLPVVRFFFTGGHFAVTIFFVISGIVLANKPLQLIHSGEFTKLSDNLASALFRRWMRLFIPVITTTFIFMTSWHLFGLWTAAAEPKSSYGAELWSWYAELKNFSFVFRTGGEPWFSYNFHAWSIPVEFKGSIVIYTSLLAFSRSTRNARLWCQAGLMFYFMYITDAAFYAMFVAGMLLCDLTLLASSHDLPHFLTRLTPYKTHIFPPLFLLSLYLGSVPSHSAEITALRASPGWYFLSFLKPQAVYDPKWFYLFFAATMLVASIPHLPRLKSFFENPFNQYLGRISFALYLVHGPVLWVLGDRLYVGTGWVREVHHLYLPGWIGRYPVRSGGPLGLEWSFLVVHAVTLPVTLCAAEVVTKTVDENSVRFAQWVYGKTMPEAVGRDTKS